MPATPVGVPSDVAGPSNDDGTAALPATSKRRRSSNKSDVDRKDSTTRSNSKGAAPGGDPPSADEGAARMPAKSTAAADIPTAPSKRHRSSKIPEPKKDSTKRSRTDATEGDAEVVDLGAGATASNNTADTFGKPADATAVATAPGALVAKSGKSGKRPDWQYLQRLILPHSAASAVLPVLPPPPRGGAVLRPGAAPLDGHVREARPPEGVWPSLQQPAQHVLPQNEAPGSKDSKTGAAVLPAHALYSPRDKKRDIMVSARASRAELHASML